MNSHSKSNNISILRHNQKHVKTKEYPKKEICVFARYTLSWIFSDEVCVDLMEERGHGREQQEEKNNKFQVMMNIKVAAIFVDPTKEQDKDNTSNEILCFSPRHERPNIVSVLNTSRNSASLRRGCVFNGHLTKASGK